MHVVYLHGFASSPSTAKGVDLGRRLTGAATSYAIPALDGGDFRAMTMDAICARAVAAIAAAGGPCLVVGSSLGGYVAALLAARGTAGIAALVLVAPAFRFAERWSEKLGTDGIAQWRRDGQRHFFHYASERDEPLGFAFHESCVAVPPLPGPIAVPIAIVHGRADDSVDWRVSREFADVTPSAELHLVQGDHRLTEERHMQLIAWCCRDLIARVGAGSRAD